MNLPLSSEQFCLFSRAQHTWLWRNEAKRLRSPLNEETLTELLLLNLKRYYPGSVTIQPFHKQEEANTGGDWAWTFLSHDRMWSQSMLVQAKRLDNFDRSYNKLDYRIGKKPTDGTPHIRQIDKLIETAKKHGQLPIYIFYNHLNNSNRIPRNCCISSNWWELFPQSWGISFASAVAVRNALPDKSFNKHRGHSLPFHCLLCSQNVGDKPARRPQGSPGVVADALSRLFTDFEVDDVAGLDMSLPFEPMRGVRPLFAEAEEVASLDDSEERDQRAEGLGRVYRGIAGAVILRDPVDTVVPD